MKRKIILSLLILVAVFTITGCGKESENKVKESNNNLITITDVKGRGYVTTFKTINNKFVQTNPKYNHVDNQELGIFMSFEYIESSKEAYDYAKTHNFLGREYSEGEVKDYKWNNYDGYSYGISDNEMYFRILLEDDTDKSVVLSVFVGPKNGKDVDFAKIFDSDDFQKFLNSIEFKKENK